MIKSNLYHFFFYYNYTTNSKPVISCNAKCPLNVLEASPLANYALTVSMPFYPRQKCMPKLKWWGVPVVKRSPPRDLFTTGGPPSKFFRAYISVLGGSCGLFYYLFFRKEDILFGTLFSILSVSGGPKLHTDGLIFGTINLFGKPT
jgi:hypothetical protein